MPSSTASDQLLAGDLLLGVELEEGTDEISTHDASFAAADVPVAPTKRNVGVTHVTERPFSCARSIHPERGRLKRARVSRPCSSLAAGIGAAGSSEVVAVAAGAG